MKMPKNYISSFSTSGSLNILVPLIFCLLGVLYGRSPSLLSSSFDFHENSFPCMWR